MLLSIIAAGLTAVAYDGPVIQTPTWTRAPSFADVAAAYPASAHGVDGSATLFCRFGLSGDLSRCVVARESPVGLGFGQAAKSLANKFTISVDPSWALGDGSYGVEVPIRLVDPNKPEMRDRMIGRPTWTTKLTPAAVAEYFPSEAAAKGLTTGRGVAQCTVSVRGALTDCRPLSAEPEGAGFAEAAAKAASSMRMSPWTETGGPVDGATVRVPVRLTVDESPTLPMSADFEWGKRPAGDAVLRAFPRQALVRGVSGQAQLRCRVQSSGALARCDVVDETPRGWGFGAAALSLAPEYRVSMAGRGHPEAGSWIEVSIPLTTQSH